MNPYEGQDSCYFKTISHLIKCVFTSFLKNSISKHLSESKFKLLMCSVKLFLLLYDNDKYKQSYENVIKVDFI
jgi:hypothetical protein